MALAVWQRTIVDEAGNVIPGASVEVRSEATGNLAILKSDRAGASGMSNPATADADGFVQFFTAGGSYRVVANSGAFSREWRYVGIGTAQEVDVEDIHGFSGLNYLRSTSTASDAAPGTVRGNSADLAGATALYFAVLDNHTNDQANRIVHYGDSSSEIRGSITLHQLAGGGEITFNVTGLSVDLREASPQLDVIEVPVAYTSGIDVFANGDSVSVEFSRTGDKGLATGVADGDKGDITVLGNAWTINPGIVTYAKMQDVSATARLLGRITAGSGVVEELTPTQATSLLNVFTSTLNGLVPLSGGGVTFLRADGTWAVPSGGGNVSGPVSSTDNTAVRFDLTTGTLLQDSTVVISDTGAVTGVAALTTSGAVTVGTTASTAPVIDPSGFGQMPEIAAPATPATGFVRLYAKSDGHLYQKDDAGLETDLATSAGAPGIPQGRLTLATGVHVMAATVSGATSVYYSVKRGRRAPLYDGSAFAMADLGGELSQALSDTTKSPAAAATSTCYDMFLWDDAGTKRCTRGPAWSSASARGTGAGTTELDFALEFPTNKNSITNGPAANRGTYVGTILTNAAGTVDYIFGTKATNGGAAVFNVWNCYNRVNVGTVVSDAAGSWAYALTAFRAANGSNTMRCSFVVGLREDAVVATYQGSYTNSTLAIGLVAVGFDSTSVFTGSTSGFSPPSVFNWTGIGLGYATPDIGARFVQALEACHTANSLTFYGNVPTYVQNCLFVGLRL